MSVESTNQTFGILARFETPGDLLAAARELTQLGYKKIDAHSPFPIHGIDEAMGTGRSMLPWIVLAGGILGALTGYGMQWWTSAVDYPLIIDGKPYNSREAWIPITFEMTILFASFAAVFGMLALNGLPRLFHPTANSDLFARATDDGFFLSVEASDDRYDTEATLALLERLGGRDLTILEA